ncbi:TPA: hypothetical protein G9C53_004936 [Salmonella enterica subsp. enterica serovar Typhimurium var. 5-]|uniref:Integrase catalytic domain-containing protein n=1 Tax=Salmonella enterica subsp. enterica serovar Typhimurium var. 5- TaxID=1620419 RepID=A0A740TUH1_SALTM|nr:hypothetical protein [Salmonella enterica subsp. enterica serovar Typhimurium var. 5-]
MVRRGSEELRARDEWLRVNENILKEKNKAIYLKRKQAIDMYIDGEHTVSYICNTTGIARSELYRHLERCIQKDERGLALGYRALIPFIRIEDYNIDTLNKVNGFDKEYSKKTGAFQQLMKEYPDLAEFVFNMVFKKGPTGKVHQNARGKDIHKAFVSKCKSLGISPVKGDYPFNTVDNGKRSLYRYINRLKTKNINLAMEQNGKDANTLFNSTGIGEKNHIIERPFERVELDGHLINAVMAIRYTTPEGDEVTDIVNRLWLLVIEDTATRLSLGYHLSLNREYNLDDVLNCVKVSIFPWEPKKLTIAGLKLPETGGFASEIIPETRFAVWDEIGFDNAKAHLANIVRPKLKELINCRTNIGPVATPTRRPFIEKLFHILDENGFNRLINTTGSNPKDRRRNNPEGRAIQYEITIDELEQLIEVLIAQRNGEPQKALNYLSPLEVLQQRINRNTSFRTLEDKYREGNSFMTIQDVRTIRGSMSEGRRPYIHYEGVDYRNEVLSENFDLIGTKLTFEVDIEDLRYVRAYLPNGSEIGLLKAQGKWGIRKHSLRIRKAINKLIYRKELYFLAEDDPIQIYHDYLAEKGKKNKHDRMKLANLQKVIEGEGQSGIEDRLVVQRSTSTDIKQQEKPNNTKNSRSSTKKKYSKVERYFFDSR